MKRKPAAYAVVTHDCIYDRTSYVVGDELDDHDVADKLVLFGFAERPGDPAPPPVLDEAVAAVATAVNPFPVVEAVVEPEPPPAPADSSGRKAKTKE